MTRRSRDHHSDPERRPEPNWDGFEPYTGPEKKPLPPAVAFLVGIVAPVLLLVAVFFGGGALTVVLIAIDRDFPRLQEWALTHTSAVFVTGGLVCVGSTMWFVWYWTRRKRR